MPHTPHLTLQMLHKPFARHFRIGGRFPDSHVSDRTTIRGIIRVLHLKFLWVFIAGLSSDEVMNDSWQAAKRPLNFSDVAVGLCRSSNCDAQLL